MKTRGTMRKLAVAALALAFSCFGLPAAARPAESGAEPGKWTMDFDAAKRVAAERHLPLLVNFTGSDWCYWCKLMDRQVFSEEAWTAWAADRLLLVWIDFPSDKTLVPMGYVLRNRALAESFDVDGYPTYVLVAEDGETVLGRLGASREATPASFIGEVEACLPAAPQPD
ncbi:MAG: thioredoxin family protein [Kiritimatiellae bacterium]|nr:thioredoxin family protein [Kiritimatiellia bacterium]